MAESGRDSARRLFSLGIYVEPLNAEIDLGNCAQPSARPAHVAYRLSVGRSKIASFLCAVTMPWPTLPLCLDFRHGQNILPAILAAVFIRADSQGVELLSHRPDGLKHRGQRLC
jgi:hypothetical protein